MHDVELCRFEKDGYTVKVLQDQDASSPKDWDQLGHLVTFHPRYEFDEDGREVFGSPEEALKSFKENGCIYLPVSMLDHSGISLYIGAGAHGSDPGGWDSGQVGWIYTTARQIREEYSCKRITKRIREQVLKVLRAEVETWDQYVTGDVWGYVIEGPDGEEVDSLWGMYGSKYAQQEAREALERHLSWEAQQVAGIGAMMHL